MGRSGMEDIFGLFKELQLASGRAQLKCGRELSWKPGCTFWRWLEVLPTLDPLTLSASMPVERREKQGLVRLKWAEGLWRAKSRKPPVGNMQGLVMEGWREQWNERLYTDWLYSVYFSSLDPRMTFTAFPLHCVPFAYVRFLNGFHCTLRKILFECAVPHKYYIFNGG